LAYILLISQWVSSPQGRGDFGAMLRFREDIPPRLIPLFNAAGLPRPAVVLQYRMVNQLQEERLT
jgi:hypothetical protein